MFEEKIQGDKPAFIKKVQAVASFLSIPANWIMAVINSETAGTFSPDIQNPNGGATGLIQFMPATAKALGTTTDALKRMSSVQQLDYVKAYFAPYKGMIDSFEDLYLVTFYPNADGIHGGTLSKPDNWSFPSFVTRQNAGLDKSKDGLITIKEFREFAFRKVPDHLENLLFKTVAVARKNKGLVIAGFIMIALSVAILYYELYKGKSTINLIKKTLK